MATRRRRKSGKGDFRIIEVVGPSDVIPNSLRLKKSQWVCWVNPKRSSGARYAIRFDINPPPLRDLNGQALENNESIVVDSGAPSTWYRFKTGIRKGTRYHYSVTARKKRGSRKAATGGPGGPEIIADD